VSGPLDVTRKELEAAILMAAAVAEAIQALGEVPSGHLYAQVMGHMSINTYQAIISTLVRTKLVVQEPSHLLRWVGPPAKAQGTPGSEAQKPR